MSLEAIIYGYTKFELRPEKIKVKSDSYGRIYLPNLGWLITKIKNQTFDLVKDKNDAFKLRNSNYDVDFSFRHLKKLEGSNVELLHYSIPILEQFYYNSNLNLLEVEIEKISQKHKEHLSKALSLIKQNIPEYYELIKVVVKKMVIFFIEPPKTSEYVLRNSFVILNVMGIAFFNAYQKEYNEVFFVDDIAHQTGHIVFHALIYNLSEFLKVDTNTVIEEHNTEARDILIIFHALYTYYTIFTCLDSLLEKRVFEKEKRHEALGRMLFYLKKCNHDLLLIENFDKSTNDGYKKIFTKEDVKIYFEIKDKFDYIDDKWVSQIRHFDLSNQPYNFSYSKFTELNPYN